MEALDSASEPEFLADNGEFPVTTEDDNKSTIGAMIKSKIVTETLDNF